MIAILLATYNGEKYLKEQIDSILSQMDRVSEKCALYVHDDGSTDGTCDILKEYAVSHPGKVELLEGPPQGGSTKNFMYMLGEVETDYYMFSDQDDVWLPEKIERQYREMKKLEEGLHSGFSGQNLYASAEMKENGSKGSDEIVEETANMGYPAMVFSDMKVVDEGLNVIDPSFYSYSNLNPHRTKLNELILENVVSGCCMMFNRRLRDLALRYSDLDKIKWHDWWITEIAAAVFGRINQCNSTSEVSGMGTEESNPSESSEKTNSGLAKMGTTIAYIPEPLMLYRQHGLNAVGAIEDVSLNRVAKKLSMILGGEQSEQTRKFIREAVDQAKQLLCLKDDISEDAYNILKALTDFDSQGKLQKIQSFRQLKIVRDKRNIWMMLHL